MPSIELTREDWEEIYYALETKKRVVDARDYGCDADNDTELAKWIEHLDAIAKKVDGEFGFSESETEAAKRVVTNMMNVEAKQFVEQIARMSLTQDGAEAIDTINSLIRTARELTGIKANPQDDAAD